MSWLMKHSNVSSFPLDLRFRSNWSVLNFMSFSPSTLHLSPFLPVSVMFNMIMYNPLGLTLPVQDTFQNCLRCLIHLYISVYWSFRLHKIWHKAYKLKPTYMCNPINSQCQNSIHGLGEFHIISCHNLEMKMSVRTLN